MSRPGPLLASGRDANIYDLGDGSVLRRARSGRSLEHEAHVMQRAHAAGYPVPEVIGVQDDGRDLLLERINGPTMLDDLAAHPWRYRRYADQLAELLGDLHSIDVATAGDTGVVSSNGTVALRQAPMGPGTSLVHLDLHPLNVLMSATGPIVIDWANAGAGVAETDVAVTWVVMAGATVPGGALQRFLGRALRDRFVQRLVGSFDRDSLRGHLVSAVAWKVTDPNTDPAEAARMRQVVERELAVPPG